MQISNLILWLKTIWKCKKSYERARKKKREKEREKQNADIGPYPPG
jgi:hypothetical protein